MHRDPIRRAVLWGVSASLLLPVMLAVVTGLGALLGGLGDAAGSRVFLRIGLVVGAAWVIALVATTIASAMAALIPHRRRWGRDCRGRGPRRRRLRHRPRHGREPRPE